jgi:hypothetical protein
LIRDPRQNKVCDQISSNIVYKQPEVGQNDKEQADPKTKAVLAREHIKKLSLEQSPGSLAAAFTNLPDLFEDRLLRYGP